MTTSAWRPFARLAVAARGFALLALAAEAVWQRDVNVVPSLVGLALVWAVGAWAQTRRWRWMASADLAEATVVGAVVGLSLHGSVALLPALALPPFLSGLRHGTRGAAEALAAELIAVVGVTTLAMGGMDNQQGLGTFLWSVAGLGLGLVAGFVHTLVRAEPDPLAAYRDARDLIQELLNLSGGLSSGLDPVALGDSLLATVRDGVPAASLALHVPRGEQLTPITRVVTDTGRSAGDELAAAAYASGRVSVEGGAFAVPLSAGSGPIAVVTGALSEGLAPDQIGLEGRLEQLGQALAPEAVRLDAALLFGALRDAATSEERRRLAREMHDGVAQEIASMGYLVDALIAGTESPEQEGRLRLLRESITSVVAEVRRSVLTLRSGVDGSGSLGAAIGSVARHLSALSGVPIKVTVDEGTTRLRPEVEAELMRITQEALNNAVRHAQASRIDVVCHVAPPDVSIVVSDDGRGIQGRRVDSHGLEIMNERARLVGAVLEIGNRPEGGTAVSVRITGDQAHAIAASPREKESVTS